VNNWQFRAGLAWTNPPLKKFHTVYEVSLAKEKAEAKHIGH
jgi:hypothetical protein